MNISLGGRLFDELLAKPRLRSQTNAGCDMARPVLPDAGRSATSEPPTSSEQIAVVLVNVVLRRKSHLRCRYTHQTLNKLTALMVFILPNSFPSTASPARDSHPSHVALLSLHSVAERAREPLL